MAASDQSSSPDIAPGLEQARETERLVSDPIRLMILGVLNGDEELSFKWLEAVVKLSPGNLGFQMSKLEEAGYITVHKRFKGKTPSTSYSLTPAGKEAITRHLQRMDAFKQGIQTQDEEKRRKALENADTKQDAPKLQPGIS